MKRLVLILAGSWAAFAQGAPAPDAAEWKTAPAITVALNRTPPLYVTDTPATLDIPSVQMQVLRAAGGTFIRLEWTDKTHDTAALPKAERTWQSENLVRQSEATERFSDACALMISAKPLAGNLNPSLQMGDAAHPVRIYFWDATRGPAIMEASGRETTKRTGQVFPAQGIYAAGKWSVTMQLPDLPPGTPVTIAIWNGSQQDRDGRKYFSIWQPLR
jgi:hypothetical protein